MVHADLPQISELAHTYTELVRRQVTVKVAPAWSPVGAPPAYVGIYEDNHRAPSALWASDPPLSAALGAVLTLLPPSAAAAAAGAPRLPDEIFDNCREIANITANNFKEKRVRLSGFFRPGGVLPAAATGLLATPNRRLDVTVSIAGYGGGRLLLLVA